MLSIVWTLALFMAIVNAPSASAEAPKQVLNGKSFQWVRGQLWVYGPHSENGVLLVQGPQLPQTEKPAVKEHSNPEELTKALQKATQHKL